MGPTNTNARYRPPPPGMAPPPPPPGEAATMDPSNNSGMGYQQQQQQQQPPPTQQSYYAEQPPQPSYYAQQPPQPPPPPQQQHSPHRQQAAPVPGGYAARSAAAHSPQRPTTGTGNAYNNTYNNNNMTPPRSQHSSGSNLAAMNAANTASAVSSLPVPNPTATPKKKYEETPFQAAEQSRLLTSALQRLTESSYSMQHSMEMNDVVSTLESACLLLEELGDPNHGVRGHNNNRGGGGPNHHHQPPPASYYSTAGGAVPPLGNYNDRYYQGGNNNNTGGGGNNSNNNGLITLLSPKNYYELHMRAMDEMPILEEFLLSMCHSIDTSSATTPTTGQPTNAISHTATSSSLSPYSCNQLYETVQYCPRVVPRLYLQICMGSVSIRTGTSKAVDVMKELSDAAKCVQCPVRGLFLRYYLLMALKDKLPDGKDGTADEDEGVTMEGNEEQVGGSTKEEEDTKVEGTGGGDVVDDSDVTTPNSPPPALPPPPPPMEDDNHLFAPSHEDDPLFSDSPLDEPQQNASVPPTSAKSNATPVPVSDDAANPSGTSSNSNTQLLGKGTVVDSYEFILQNLLEMNRLWIRIQHMPGDKTKETKRRRERERNDLRILVGSNLNRLSQLEGISAHTYGSTILPRILQEVASCRDPLAQAYLMDCIIQVFPDEFHLETLEVFLGVLPKLRDKVNTRTILNNMMERLLHYYQDETLVDGELDTNDVKKAMAINSFDMFEDCVQRVFEARGLNIPPKDVIRLQGCLLNYALKISPGNIELISRCIGMCAGALGALKEQKKASMMGQGIVVGGGTTRSSEIDMESVATAALESLLSVPLDQLALKVLDLPDFSVLLSFLPWENRKVVALSMVKSVVAGGDGAKVKDVAQLEQLLEILAPLLRDKGASGPASFEPAVDDGGSLISRTANLMGTLGINSSDNDVFNGGIQKAESFGGDVQRANQFRQEQTLVAKLVHVLDHEDTDVAYQMLNIARKHITPGGPKRASMTLPPIIFEALLLLRRVQAMEFPPPVASQKETEPENAEEESKDIAQPKDTKETEDAMTNEDEEETQSAVEEKTEAKAEDSNNDGDPAENGEPEENSSPDDGVNEGETVLDAEADVTDKASAPEESISKEPKTEESSSEEAAPLFPPFNKSVNVNTYHNPQRVLECLQRGLKIADACSRQSSSNIQLFVEILDYYVYYYEVGNPAITDKFVSGLIALIKEHLESVGGTSSTAVAETKTHYGQIVDLIMKKKSEKETAERFGVIVC
ncbi:hypothetical protein ACHAWC_004663 [Mediolabrus comicus]